MITISSMKWPPVSGTLTIIRSRTSKARTRNIRRQASRWLLANSFLAADINALPRRSFLLPLSSNDPATPANSVQCYYLVTVAVVLATLVSNFPLFLCDRLQRVPGPAHSRRWSNQPREWYESVACPFHGQFLRADS